MKHVLLIGLVAVVLLAAVGCRSKLVPLTGAMITDYELTSTDLRRLQYYVSGRVVMSREVNKYDRELNRSRLKFVNGRYVHEVLIRKRLRGVAEEVRPNRLEISFKQGSQFGFLLDTNKGDKFYMAPVRIDKDGYFFMYEGYEYRSSSASNVYLLVAESGLSKFRKEREKLPGRTVDRYE